MLSVTDALDAIFLGAFLFGLVFAAASLLFGIADLGFDADADGPDLGPINVGTVLAFVAWFGGIGYLAHTVANLPGLVGVGLALAGGIGGAWLIFLALRRLRREGQGLNPADFQLPGTLARVTSTIRPSGTGEIVYEQQGVRQVAAARAVDGVAIGRGTEVVVLRMAGGFALVSPWDALIAETDAPAEAGPESAAGRAT